MARSNFALTCYYWKSIIQLIKELLQECFNSTSGLFFLVWKKNNTLKKLLPELHKQSLYVCLSAFSLSACRFCPVPRQESHWWECRGSQRAVQEVNMWKDLAGAQQLSLPPWAAVSLEKPHLRISEISGELCLPAPPFRLLFWSVPSNQVIEGFNSSTRSWWCSTLL